MDWATLAGKLIGIGAPLIGNILLGPVGGQMGNMVGGLLGQALGVPPTPEAIARQIDSDPAAIERVKSIEVINGNDLKAWEAQLLDAQNARAMFTQLQSTGSKISYIVPALTIIWTLGYFGTLVALIYLWCRTSDPVASQLLFGVVNLMIGTLVGASVQSNNFWFGTTKSSHDNGVAMRQVAASK